MSEIAKVDEDAAELVTLEGLSGNAPVAKYSDDDFDEMKTSSFLARLQLMTANADKCKKGEFPVNHYAVVEG